MFVDGTLQFIGVEFLLDGVENGRNPAGLNKASFSWIEHVEGLPQRCKGVARMLLRPLNDLVLG